MKSAIKILLIISILMMLNCQHHQNNSVKVMTYNIRYDNPKDSINSWQNRKVALYKQILAQKPDLLGTQEGLAHQIDFLEKHLTNYKKIGIGREDAKRKGEFCAIFYHSKKYKLLKEGTFWLSDTPDKISVGWDAALERICTYGIFENLENQGKILILNAHFDHIGAKARTQSAKLIKRKIKTLTKKPIPTIFMGDLNVLPQNPAIATLSSFLTDSRKAPIIKGRTGTFNAFKTNYEEKRIDYIFSNEQLTALSYQVLDERYSQKYLSDHFPVVVVYKISSP